MAKDIEKIGGFYLGKVVNPSTGKTIDQPLLYDSKNFTTHAVCLGMTGSGKTGLGIDILEEAGLDQIPALIIDPKGDLTNLLLTFPNQTASEFRPWVDPAEAEREGVDIETYAEGVAKTWKEGLAEWGETPERIQKLRDSVEMVIYTPANHAGVPISILSSFAAPPQEIIEDAGAFRDRVMSVTSSLLGLVGIHADPIKSREHILISTLIEQAWREGTDFDIATLIQRIQKPPFNKIGALDIDTFFPLKERTSLSISLNNLLASPGFQAWMEGDPLDIEQLLFNKQGKPKFAILYIAHLSDSERMFFVTLLLNEVISWMRRKPGTSNLRALLYMDEIFGFFPPTAMPPSKMPMLTLLKQARAYGLGVVLATQNPVDLDYKGLSNCGTWFIGKLQTERDKARVTEGLAIASNGEIDTESLDKMLAAVSKRTFIMRSIYEKDPVLFRTRWTMSYLRGPLTLPQIKRLTKKADLNGAERSATRSKDKQERGSLKPVIPVEISEFFINAPAKPPVQYTPQVVGLGKMHFVDTKNKIDEWQEISWLAPADTDGKTILWEEGKSVPGLKTEFENDAIPESAFGELPSGLMQPKNYAAFGKSFAAFIFQSQVLHIYYSPLVDLLSKEGESESDFRARVIATLRERNEEMVAKVRQKYAEKIDALTAKLKSAQDKVAQRQQKAGWTRMETWISLGATILGALLGRGITKGTITQTGTSIRRAGRIGMEDQGVTQAEESTQAYQQQIDDLHIKLQREISEVFASIGDASGLKIEKVEIHPRKSDISVEKVALVWVSE